VQVSTGFSLSEIIAQISVNGNTSVSIPNPSQVVAYVERKALLNNNLYKTELVGYVLGSAERQTKPGCAPGVEREDVDASAGDFERVPGPSIRSRESSATGTRWH
jgi:hypothetical protein